MSRRTVFRDIEALRAAGVPVRFDADLDRYSMPAGYYLPPVNFTAAEAVSLVALASELGRSDRIPFYEPAQTAALKLEGSLPASLREELKLATRTVRIQPARVSPLADKRGIYEQLVSARAEKRVVRIEYESLTEWTRIATKLRPYHLLFCRHSWYVIGRSSLHSAVRTFNLSRIVSLEPLTQRYAIPRRFSIERHLGNAWQLIPGEGDDHQVAIRFLPMVARNVGEVVWHRTQQLEYLDDGSLIFRVLVSGLDEITWWVLGYGDQAEVLEPPELRQRVAQRARRMAAMYNGEGQQVNA